MLMLGGLSFGVYHPNLLSHFRGAVQKAIEPLVSWLLIIVGWFFIRWDSNKREDRHELRSTVDSVTEDIKALEKKAYRYYTSEPNGESIVLLQVEIKRDQDALEARLALLKKSNRRFQSVEKVSIYRRVLMGGDFEAANRQKSLPTDSKLLEISFAAKQLIDELELEYSHQIYNH